jgi:hypothetical protein
MLKGKIAIIIPMILMAGILSAQDMQQIFDRNAKVTWLGLDFSGAKFIGDRERFGSTSDVQHLIASWNDLMVNEKNKFDVGQAIDKIRVNEGIEIAKDHNANLDVTEIFSNEAKDHFHLKPDDIAAIVADYDYKGYSGIGVMFNVESFSKTNEEAAIWITFINMDSKEVFFTERLTEKPSGFGMRNYWAGAIYGILKKMEKKEFEMWRKKYFRK